LLTNNVIAKKPNNKSPEVTYTLSGFLVIHLFSDPASAAAVVFWWESFRSGSIAIGNFGFT